MSDATPSAHRSPPLSQPHAPEPTPAKGVRRRNRRGEGVRLREEIIEGASALLAQSGDPDQISFRGVARQIGIAPMSIYRHFRDVDQLILAVADRFFARLAEAQEQAAAAESEPLAVLLARCRAYCRFGLEHPGEYRLMFRSELAPGRELGFQDAPGRAVFDRLVAAVAMTIEDEDEDRIRRLAALIWSLEHGLVSLQISRPRFPWSPIEAMVEDGVRRLC